MANRRDDEVRNTKPIRIPSVPPPTGAHPVIRHGDEADEKRPRPPSSGGGGV